MIQLVNVGDYLGVFGIAGAAGLLGGLAAELLLNRDGVTGAFERPGRKSDLYDLGGFASLIVGLVAGIAILVVFPPEVSTSTSGDVTTTTTSYDLLRLVTTSLVAGSAGGSILTALQARVSAAVNAAKVDFVRSRGEDEVDRVRNVAKRQLEKAARSAGGAPEARSRGIGDAAGAAPGAAVDSAIADAAAEIDAAADEGRQAVSNAARNPAP